MACGRIEESRQQQKGKNQLKESPFWREVCRAGGRVEGGIQRIGELGGESPYGADTCKDGQGPGEVKGYRTAV